MKKLLSSCVLFYFCTIVTAFSGELTVRVPVDAYPPFFMQGDDGKWQGLSIELTEALFRESGFKPVYTPLPFKRALKYLEIGSLDMMMNLTVTKERAAFLNFIGPMLDETVVLVVSKDSNFSIETLEDIKHLPGSISVELGKVYGDAFEDKRAHDKVFAQKISVVQHLSSCEKMLETGHTIGFLGYGYHVFHRFKTNPLYKKFAVHPYIFRQDWVSWGFSKKSLPPDALQLIQAAFDRLRQKGTFEEIKHRYTHQ